MKPEDLIQSVFNDIDTFNIDDIPNIELYMDQVTTYLNNKFDFFKRHEDDKLLTKTMINNYTKSNLLPSPEKKKYSKDHILVLTMIFFFKNIISMNDTTTLLQPLLNKYFHNSEIPLENIIHDFLSHIKAKDLAQPIIKDLENLADFSSITDAEDKDYIQTLELVSLLSYDIFVRKMIIEKLIDSLPENKKEP